MTSPIEVRSKLKLIKVVEDIIADRQRKFKRAMEEAAREIVERTTSGRDVNGRAFAKYTDKYAAWKSGYTTSGGQRRKKGTKTVTDKDGNKKTISIMRKVKSNLGAGGKVNLILSGNMLDNITTIFSRTATELIGRITFSSSREADKARGNMEKRKFFELSQKQRKAIVDKLK